MNLYRRIRQSKFAGKFPTKEELNSIFLAFTKKERVVFFGLVLVFAVSAISILDTLNKSMMVAVPAYGGTISEGVIGNARFVNPLLANSPADLDMVSLVYSGLMRKNPDGTLTPDLAEKYVRSKNGLTYTFTLKDNIYFHNGDPVTADDIVFTVNEAKDSIIKSPRKPEWDGVTVSKVDQKTIEFVLKQPYPAFLENATLGIMPVSLWSNSPIELNNANTNPVGSGPYMIKNVVKESSGVINSYELEPFEEFALGEPYIQNLNLFFYSNENELIQALEDGVVDQISSITPLNADILKERNFHIESYVLPRVFGLFFNQNQNRLFTDKVVTRAIDQAIDKDKIIREMLFGYGVAIDDPIPPNMPAYQELAVEKEIPREQILKSVEESLAKDGWTKGVDGYLEKTTTEKGKKTTAPLQFSISTGNAPELARAAQLIQDDLADLGMKVDVKTFELGNLNQGVIRPRKYDALLFGEIISHESDLFAFWHSSQRKDPGLNVALYTNPKVDKILEDAFITIDEAERVKKYFQFQSEIRKDMPAVFLYSPNFIYVVSPKLEGLSIGHIISPADRFSNVYSWYAETENVWKIFTK